MSEPISLYYTPHTLHVSDRAKKHTDNLVAWAQKCIKKQERQEGRLICHYTFSVDQSKKPLSAMSQNQHAQSLCKNRAFKEHVITYVRMLYPGTPRVKVDIRLYALFHESNVSGPVAYTTSLTALTPLTLAVESENIKEAVELTKAHETVILPEESDVKFTLKSKELAFVMACSMTPEAYIRISYVSEHAFFLKLITAMHLRRQVTSSYLESFPFDLTDKKIWCDTYHLLWNEKKNSTIAHQNTPDHWFNPNVQWIIQNYMGYLARPAIYRRITTKVINIPKYNKPIVWNAPHVPFAIAIILYSTNGRAQWHLDKEQVDRPTLFSPLIVPRNASLSITPEKGKTLGLQLFIVQAHHVGRSVERAQTLELKKQE